MEKRKEENREKTGDTGIGDTGILEQENKKKDRERRRSNILIRGVSKQGENRIIKKFEDKGGNGKSD